MDEELIQSRREDDLENSRPERHFYACPTISEEGDLGDTMMSSSLQSLNSSEDGDLGDTISTLQSLLD